jgi:uncharacterized phage-associated protein
MTTEISLLKDSHRKTLKSAIDIACYFLCRVDRDAGDTISLLKLQKLLYYGQAWSLVLRKQPLFYQEIEAWVSGPVVRDVWNEYQVYKYGDIPVPDRCDIEWEEDELEVLEEVWNTYGELSARHLQNLTHSELPWRKAREGLEPAEKSKNVISMDDMQSYYGALLED